MRRLKERIWRLFDLKLRPLRAVLFNIIAVCGLAGGLVALVVSAVIRIDPVQLLAIGLSESVLMFSFYLVNRRHRLDLAVFLIGLIAVTTMPWMFFAGGGVFSGMPFWFVMAIVFTFLLAEGKLLAFLSILEIAVYTGCFLLDYYCPNYTTPIETTSGRYLDIWQSMLCLALVTGVITFFHGRVYRRMHVQDTIHRRELEKAKQEMEAAQEAYKKLAYTDLMTGLRNRSAFENYILRLKREPPRDGVHFIVADLNRLKEINDRLGHEAGDSAIRCAGRSIAKVFGEDCRCYRIGGDEFCIISERLTGPEVEERIEVFRRRVSGQEVAPGWPLSMAVGWHAADAAGYDEAFRTADQKMYRRKEEMGHRGV